MASHTLRISSTIGGVSIAGNMTESGDVTIGLDPELPAAKAGTMKTKTNATDGVITVASHGMHQADIVDIYWLDAVTGLYKCAYGGIISGVNGNDVTFTGCAGDELPVALTVITAVEPTDIEIATFVGDNVELIAASCPKAANFRFLEGAAIELAVRLQPGGAYSWALSSGLTNPIAGETISALLASQSDSSAARTLKIGVAMDSGT